jgi:hypothetical protein
MSYFPFEEYIASTSEEEYHKDINMRNSIVKYINAILIDPNECAIPMRKFKNICLFFKNTFCKESFLYYYLNRFDEDERKILNYIVFIIFIEDSDGGVIGEHKKFYELSYELFSEMDINTPVIDSWNYINKEQI